ncbi:MAG: hypothetical protein J7L69_12280 [Desulfobulbaceae bacterium]|nr:hypothetical protein [Desulfobulbaceae bacterium]
MNHRIQTIFLIGLLFLFANLSSSFARTITLSWDPNTEYDLAGYMVFVGQTSGEYDASYSVDNDVNEYELDLPNDGLDYFLALIAFDTSGNESEFSEEVIVEGETTGSSDDLPSNDLPSGGSSADLLSQFGQEQFCGPNNLDTCTQLECEDLGPDYWWYDSCRKGQQQENYDGRIAEAPVRLGNNANDGKISTGDGFSLVLNVPETVRTYALLVFPNADYDFLDNDNLFTKKLVSITSGRLPVTDDLCWILEDYPDFAGTWWIAFFTTPASAEEFHDLNELEDYINNGGVYHFGSYNITVDCQN